LFGGSGFVDRHSSYIYWLGRFGLLFTIPLAILLILCVRNLIKIIKQTRHHSDHALVTGITAAFCAYILTGFVTPIQGDFHMDVIAWVYIGLAIVWAKWLKIDPNARLVAG